MKFLIAVFAAMLLFSFISCDQGKHSSANQVSSLTRQSSSQPGRIADQRLSSQPAPPGVTDEKEVMAPPA
ncbi:MAG TPA: hypothetical protein VE933_06615, partial [Chitinophagaceae bacterium]|nr:hypothetical protein [Chitinophagaceae bacterium]